ncbi:hypothetical protein M2418_004183 [Rhizobium sp. BIGb0125]|nr:hypothetical protein [Rhizobium sp. BIGb0125]MCS4244642.1 hypothetical protein [Rhizobium sp. BIGb0125]
MRKMVILAVVASVFAAPCIYDITSTEPSALAGLFSLAMAY